MKVEDIKITDVMKYFGMKTTDFARDWRALSDAEKQQFKAEVAAVLPDKE